jgi:hypothetical protein
MNSNLVEREPDVLDEYITAIFRIKYQLKLSLTYEFSGFFLGSQFDPEDGGDIFR